jgi:hypothetical protein
LVSPNIGTFLRADRQVVFFFQRDVANQGFANFPVKVRKYMIKAFLMPKILHHSYFV